MHLLVAAGFLGSVGKFFGLGALVLICLAAFGGKGIFRR